MQFGVGILKKAEDDDDEAQENYEKKLADAQESCNGLEYLSLRACNYIPNTLRSIKSQLREMLW